MDDLAAIVGSFAITSEPNRTSAPHPRYSQYKERTPKYDQNSRRKQLLELQKNQRFDYLSHVRRLTDNDWNNKEEKEEDDDESMELEHKLSRPGRYYKNQLMMSEWLVEVPSNLETEWITVLCPVAKRCLVVTSRAKTKAYSKSGYCINTFPSHLPGGCRSSREKNTTILDCLYSEANQTYYILDLMCWNGCSVYDSETEFRFYWMHEKLREYSSLQETSSSNPFKFIGLPSFGCTQDVISTAIASAAFQIDGILFYHKRTHYIFGSSPLVVWLKPFMLEEILGITVPDCQKVEMPQNYTNYAEHMKQVEEERLKQEKLREERQKQGDTGKKFRQRHGRRRKEAGEMDTSHPESDGLEQSIEIDSKSMASAVDAEALEQIIDIDPKSVTSAVESAPGLGIVDLSVAVTN
ncbi:unnamed protein product [Candidula unifasciata]|uniref:Snurportin-1 n=1 Tax=Candidula unifasciata TaxID=100452 RepID=A0A8S3ZXF7_9EUPU|nr:unnamed protein product [Candidula unifasciata]